MGLSCTTLGGGLFLEDPTGQLLIVSLFKFLNLLKCARLLLVQKTCWNVYLLHAF